MFNIKVLLNFFDLNFIKKNLLLFLLFALVPFGELLFILYVGEHFGRYLVFALAVTTGLVGFFLSYNLIQGVIIRIKRKIKNDEYPGQDFLGLAGAVVAAILLISPGFLTDIVGILLFIPGIRNGVGKLVVSRMEIQLKELYEYLKLYEY
ncbi:MAG: FxsA family protein [Spirochaetales bacterium]|nr:FxsA family protein [Spirochaetales bacterium]